MKDTHSEFKTLLTGAFKVLVMDATLGHLAFCFQEIKIEMIKHKWMETCQEMILLSHT